MNHSLSSHQRRGLNLRLLRDFSSNYPVHIIIREVRNMEQELVWQSPFRTENLVTRLSEYRLFVDSEGGFHSWLDLGAIPFSKINQ